MARRRGVKILEELFRRGGYAVEESFEPDFDLIAERDGEKVKIIIREVIRGEDLDYYRHLAEEIDETILMVATGKVEGETCPDGRVVVWDRGRFAEEIGMAVIADIEGSRFMVNLKGGMDTIPTVPLRLKKSKAFEIARKSFRSIKGVQLRYIPIWSFEYRFRSILHDGVNPFELKGEGRTLFNALTGRALDIEVEDHPSEIVPAAGSIIEPVEVDDNSLKEAVIEQIIREGSREISIEKRFSDAIISEQKILRPKREDIQIESHLFYLPIWEIEGDRGFMQIDAASGKEIVDPMDDGVEIL